VVRRAARFHDDEPDVPVLKPAFELQAGQAMLFGNFPLVIANGNLEYSLGQINGHGSSMHFGLLVSKTDPHPPEHRWRVFGAEKTGESIPSFQGTLRDKAAQRRRTTTLDKCPQLHR
jgi:hypothetical protein